MKQPADSGKRSPQEIASEPKRRRIDSSSSSGDKDGQQTQDFASQIVQSGNRVRESMEKLIAKKRRDEQEESEQERSVIEDKENFLILLEELIAATNESQQREAVIDQIEEIKAIEAIMKMIQSLSDRARDYKAAATAEMADNDQDFRWFEEMYDDLRTITYEVLEQGFRDLYKK